MIHTPRGRDKVHARCVLTWGSPPVNWSVATLQPDDVMDEIGRDAKMSEHLDPHVHVGLLKSACAFLLCAARSSLANGGTRLPEWLPLAAACLWQRARRILIV